ncbi:phosphotransferase [Pseudocolwellia sp. HL-MZ19]|uniref:phosphotransferase n=1 Tax=unclassified Pseudocolwellia TaxID=2848178 RepID=UPI003CF29121
MNVDKYAQLCEKIKQLPCFNLRDDESLLITKIEAGQSSSCFDVSITNNKNITSDNVLITSITQRYFVKYDSNASFFENELKTSQAASNINLSPHVIYAEKNWLVNEFIYAESLDSTTSNIKSKIEIAIKLMQQCHTLDVSLPELNINEIITQIIASKSFSIAQREHIQLLFTHMSTIGDKPQSHSVVCHGDINFSNIITANNKAWLIDFECACLAEKEFELAMFMAINFMNADEQALTLAYYEKLNNANDIRIDQNKLDQYLSYSYLINGLWYFEKVKGMQGTNQGNKKDVFYDLAIKQLTLFDEVNPAQTVLSQLLI